MHETPPQPRKPLEENPMMDIERGKENPLTEAGGLLVEAFDIPSGAFSGIATYRDAEGNEHRIAPEVDKAMAEHFTNVRYIVKELNGIGPITTKDPRERYTIEMGKIDAVIEQSTKDLDAFRETVEHARETIETQNLPPEATQRADRLFAEVLQIYEILRDELALKKRGFELLGSGEMTPLLENKLQMNAPLEVRYLPGGNVVILRGYAHNPTWQKNFGDDRNYDTGLATIYSDVDYIAIEGFFDFPYGTSLSYRWSRSNKKNYDRLMKELVKNGFDGTFVELDARYCGRSLEKTFDQKDLTREEAKKLFAFQKKHNPDLTDKIGTVDRFMAFYHKQRSAGFPDSWIEREEMDGHAFINNGTYYGNSASVNNDLTTSSMPTGFELGQIAFSDALSVIKILIMNEAINNGDIAPGILVDVQGAAHLSCKSFFFENPAYAMEVVLANVHEILASHPEIENTDDILEKLAHMDKKTWKWVFDFIGTIPFANVAEPTETQKSVECGEQQRPMINQTPHKATEHFSKKQQAKMEKALAVLTRV